MAPNNQPVDIVVAAVLASASYSTVCPETVRAVATAELRASASTKQAVKRVKRKLHQIGGAYQSERMPYGAWLAELRAAPHHDALLATCRRIMQAHTSSRERLAYLETFYARTLAPLGPIRHVLDVACGLNPLALPWMGLSPEACYDCVDIYADQMAFLQTWLGLIGQPGTATCSDVLLSPPHGSYDVALLLKTVPCLQQLDSSATERLIAQLDTRYLIVSFPAKSLGGRNIGMIANYQRSFERLLCQVHLTGDRQIIGDELVYTIVTGRM